MLGHEDLGQEIQRTRYFMMPVEFMSRQSKSSAKLFQNARRYGSVKARSTRGISFNFAL